MNVEIRMHVLQLLEDYPERERKIALLRYELEHPTQISLEEMIDSMTFSSGDSINMAKNHVSNKTLYIALNYQQRADHINREAADEIAAHLVELEQTQDRLKNYIALLDERHRDVIQYLYVEKRHIKEVARQLGIALRSVHKVKDAAIDKLTEMYEYTGKLS